MLLLYDIITRDQSDCSHMIGGGPKIIAWIDFSMKSKHQRPNHSTSNRILIVFLPFLVRSFDCRQWEDLTQVWLCLLFIWDQNCLPSFLPLLSFYDASRNDAKSTCWYKNRLHILFYSTSSILPSWSPGHTGATTVASVAIVAWLWPNSLDFVTHLEEGKERPEACLRISLNSTKVFLLWRLYKEWYVYYLHNSQFMYT